MASILQSIKVSAAVSVASGGTYTAPATGYAIVTVSNSTGSSISFSVATRGSTLTAVNTVGSSLTIYVGPGQQLALNSGTVAYGVEFINTT